MMFNNKKGKVLLKDLIFMMLIFFSIIALSNIFVSEMGDTYDNVNMTTSYNQDSLGEDNLTYTYEKWEEIGDKFNQGGIWNFLEGGFESIGLVLTEIFTAPHTFSTMITSIMEDFGAPTEITSILRMLISGILYGLIIFMIVKAFLRGGEI